MYKTQHPAVKTERYKGIHTQIQRISSRLTLMMAETTPPYQAGFLTYGYLEKQIFQGSFTNYSAK